MDVYITDVSAFLPNEPVGNDEMEQVLGMVHEVPSRTRRIILRNNGILQRYYAIDPKSGEQTHTNVQLAVEAIRGLAPYAGFTLDDIECLCCGTSTPDTLLPGHALGVHGELGNASCEVVTTAGICLSCVTALKYGYMNVALGLTKNAVCTGSELASSFTSARFFGAVRHRDEAPEPEKPAFSFSSDFLRWMLSDGAGAVFLTSDKPSDRLSLRVDWIEHRSFANELETCMYAGGQKNVDGTITGWRAMASAAEAVATGAMLIHQDVKLLNEEIMYTAGERMLPGVIERRGLKAEDVDWYLPHYSSDYFREPLHEHMKNAGLEIPFDRWFTNLPEKGNTGAAASFIILEEFRRSGLMKEGQRILCFIPESGRFSMAYVMLTVV